MRLENETKGGSFLLLFVGFALTLEKIMKASKILILLTFAATAFSAVPVGKRAQAAHRA